MLDTKVMQAIETVTRQLKLETAALAAVAHIESGLRTHAMVNGKAEPLIRFEGHYFDRRLSGETRDRARRQGLASPTAGTIANPRAQAARWALLTRAAAIDRKAAYESVSWGIGQVMGAHWAWLGYASVDALVEEARSGVKGQLRLMARYIERAGLAGALRARDWERFAHGYNGPAFRKNGYHLKLEKAYHRYAARASTSTPPHVLRIGAAGEAVRSLQTALSQHGYPIRVDGLYGPATENAVRSFQAHNRLLVDGIAGPATMATLHATDIRPSPQGLLTRIVNWFRRGKERGHATAPLVSDKP